MMLRQVALDRDVLSARPLPVRTGVLLALLAERTSLAGPRPLPLPWRDGGLMEEWQRRRQVVVPGMRPGSGQVGGRSHLGFDDMVELDVRAIDTWSLRGDAYMLRRTAGVVLGSRGGVVSRKTRSGEVAA